MISPMQKLLDSLTKKLVFVVYTGSYENINVEGIFATRELAEKFMSHVTTYPQWISERTQPTRSRRMKYAFKIGQKVKGNPKEVKIGRAGDGFHRRKGMIAGRKFVPCLDGSKVAVYDVMGDKNTGLCGVYLEQQLANRR